MWYFIVSGFLNATVVSIALWFYTGPEFHPAILGFRGLIHFFLFPFVGAALAAFWVWILQSFVGWRRVGVMFGAAVATLSFVTFNALLAVYVATVFISPYTGLPFGATNMFGTLFVAYTMFGGIFFGWLLIAFGGITGWCVRRRSQQL